MEWEAASERGGCWDSCSSWRRGVSAPLATNPRCPYLAIESPLSPSGHHRRPGSPGALVCVLWGEIRQGDSCVTVIFHSIILLPASTPSPRSIFFFFFFFKIPLWSLLLNQLGGLLPCCARNPS